MSEIIKLENVGKEYRLGEYNAKAVFNDIKSWFSKEEKQIVANDRTVVQGSFVHALADINFAVKPGEVLGIIGRNGAGKSTLLKLLSRVTAPSSGRITLKGRVGSLLEVGTGFHPDLTGRENIFLNGAILGMSKKEIAAKFDEMVEFAGVQKYIDTPVKRYSSGMYVRLAFAVAAHLEPEILIVDEVLAVGDAEFQEKCVGKMRSVSGQGRTVLFVSHNMSTIRHLCSRAILLENGRMAGDGPVEAMIEKYLSHSKVLEANGSVPTGKGIGNGEGKIEKVLFKNTKNESTQDFFFSERIKLELEINSLIAVDNALCGIQIKNGFNESIVDYVNIYDECKLNLKSGLNSLEIELENKLLPGKYNVNITIARLSGVAIDSLESIAEIKISHLGTQANNNYPFSWINGFVKGAGSWKIV